MRTRAKSKKHRVDPDTRCWHGLPRKQCKRRGVKRVGTRWLCRQHAEQMAKLFDGLG